MSPLSSRSVCLSPALIRPISTEPFRQIPEWHPKLVYLFILAFLSR